MNLVVTETPFGEDRLLHVGAHDGRADWGVGHADDADLTLTTDYVTAREIFMAGDPQAAHPGVHGGQGQDPGRPHQADGGAGRRAPAPAAPGLAERARRDHGVTGAGSSGLGVGHGSASSEPGRLDRRGLESRSARRRGPGRPTPRP